MTTTKTPDIEKIREALKMIDHRPPQWGSIGTHGMSLSEKAGLSYHYAVLTELRSLVYDQPEDPRSSDDRRLDALLSTLDPSCLRSVSHPLGSDAYIRDEGPDFLLIDFAAWLMLIHDSIRCQRLLDGRPDRLYEQLRLSPHFKGIVEFDGHDWMSFSPALLASLDLKS
jgi:hypothetical protein